MAGSNQITVVRCITQCSVVDTSEYFSYYEDRSSRSFLLHVGTMLPHYTASHPKHTCSGST